MRMQVTHSYNLTKTDNIICMVVAIAVEYRMVNIFNTTQ